MKKIFDKKAIFSFILGIILCGGVVYGVNLYSAEDITYNSIDTNINNVDAALDDLYNIKNLGDAKPEDILEGSTAVVQGQLIEGIKKDKNLSIISVKGSAGNYTNLEPGTYALVITGTVQSNGSTRPSASISFNVTGGELISKKESKPTSSHGPDWYGFHDTVWLFTITDETNTIKTAVTYGTPNVGCFKVFSVLVGLE